MYDTFYGNNIKGKKRGSDTSFLYLYWFLNLSSVAYREQKETVEEEEIIKFQL